MLYNNPSVTLKNENLRREFEMSQEKVDKRKAEKANRKKQLGKKTQKRIMNILIAVIVTVAFIAIVILAAGQLSGKFVKETTSAAVTLSDEEMSSLKEAMGIEETEETTTAAEETSSAE
ncbi:MAG: hypothetical protein SPF70_04575 [Lachnospiraceae bacterium]|nr:hypothetical protein [Lachnospiraceae bacterium]